MPEAERRVQRVAVLGRYVFEHPARRGERLARDGAQVLEPDRDPGEDRGRTVTPYAGGAEALVRPGGGRESVLLVDAYPRVDRAGIPFVAVHAVHVTDPCEERLGELGRRHLATGEPRRRLADAEPRELVGYERASNVSPLGSTSRRRYADCSSSGSSLSLCAGPW
jgi:hypothetical protein